MLASSCRLRTIEPSGMILLTAKGYSIYELDICTVTFSVGFHFSVRFFPPVSGGRGSDVAIAVLCRCFYHSI